MRVIMGIPVVLGQMLPRIVIKHVRLMTAVDIHIHQRRPKCINLMIVNILLYVQRYVLM